MNIKLSDHFTYAKLLRYTLPSMAAMVFTSIYGIVDGVFVSNFAGKEAFAAVNLVYPVFMIISAIGFMLGSGGSAIVAKTLGEGRKKTAQEYFSLLVMVTLVLGIVATLIMELLMPRIVVWLGAEDHLVDYGVLYGRVTTLSMPAFMLQTSFQTYFNVAEKPRLGLLITVISGCANIVLDGVLVGGLHMGLLGAALATNVSEIAGGIIPIFYFMRKNTSLLRLRRAPFHGGVILKACTNGSSEMLSNLSSSVVSILYNYKLLQYGGTDAVAAYGAIMYSAFIFAAIFIGYCSGSAPVISYHYGAKDDHELKSLFRKSLWVITGFSLMMTAVSELFSRPVSRIFVGYDDELLAMTVHGFHIFAVSFLIFGFNIFGSAFFTALGDGGVSAVLSFLRTFLFKVAVILSLPYWFGLDGIWIGTVVSEVMALIVTLAFFIGKKNKYRYI